MKKLVIIGTGGFGRETYDAILTSTGFQKEWSIKGFVKDAGYKEIGNFDEHFPEGILGTIDDYAIAEDDVFFCAVGDTDLKIRFVEKIKQRGGKFVNIIDNTAIVTSGVKLGEGVRVGPFNAISNNVKIGDHTTLLTSVVVGHDVTIGDFCQIGTFCHFGGFSSIGNRSTVHPQVVVLPKVSIAEDTIIGAGSLVVRNVKVPNQTLFGSPAKPLIKI